MKNADTVVVVACWVGFHGQMDSGRQVKKVIIWYKYKHWENAERIKSDGLQIKLINHNH